MLDPDDKRVLKSAVTTMSGQVLIHLRRYLREEAQGQAEERLSNIEIRFDTIPRIALEEVRAAYVKVLDDPVALEKLKNELTA